MIPKYGDWKIVRKIGSGSFGAVYEIEKKDYGVFRAALKVITIPQSDYMINDLRSAGMDDQSVRRYFEGEIEEIVKEFVLMSRLKGNSNIVSYEDHKIVPREDKIAWDIYIRMELLTPLDEYFHSHAVTRQDVIRLGIDMCRALEQCQKMKIIHRDIKPSNILVSQLGDFKLGDFGISRTADRTVSNMTQGQGTPDYMAPEVYKGQPYGSSVDIYSLGIVMYRFLNKNRLPFLPQYPAPISYEDNVRARTQRLSGVAIPPPCEDHTRLSEIVLKACSYEPSDRYSSPVLMRQELESILYTDEDRKLFELKDEELAHPTANLDAEKQDDRTRNIFIPESDLDGNEENDGVNRHGDNYDSVDGRTLFDLQESADDRTVKMFSQTEEPLEQEDIVASQQEKNDQEERKTREEQAGKDDQEEYEKQEKQTGQRKQDNLDESPLSETDDFGEKKRAS